MLPNKLIRGFEVSIKRASSVLNAVGMGVLLALMLLGTVDIIGRYVFSRPVTGSTEVGEVLLAGMTFLALAYTQVVEAHVKADIVTSRFSSRSRVMTKLAISFLLLPVFGLMTWQAAKTAILYWETGRLVDVLYLPLAPFQLLVSLGALVLCFVLISQILQSVLKLKERS